MRKIVKDMSEEERLSIKKCMERNIGMLIVKEE
jgi:hypothetical protein